MIVLDLRSDIHGTSGAAIGAAVRATRTITFFRKKLGHVLVPGRFYFGQASVADIGIGDGVGASHAQWWKWRSMATGPSFSTRMR